MAGLEPHQEKKLDDILGGLNQIIPQVRDLKEDTREIRDDVQELKITNATQDARIEALDGHINGVGAKVRSHVENGRIHSSPHFQPISNGWKTATDRWKFFGAVTASVIALLTLGATIAKLF